MFVVSRDSVRWMVQCLRDVILLCTPYPTAHIAGSDYLFQKVIFHNCIKNRKPDDVLDSCWETSINGNYAGVFMSLRYGISSFGYILTHSPASDRFSHGQRSLHSIELYFVPWWNLQWGICVLLSVLSHLL